MTKIQTQVRWVHEDGHTYIEVKGAGKGPLAVIAIELRASACPQFISYFSKQDGNNKDQ